jgi:ADP-ribosyl-[dinitrogen reductase] hydrolase
MKGSCLCKFIEYEIDQLDTPIQHCSCHTCRKAHAAAFNTVAGVLKEHFRWLKGSEHLRYYESSPGKLRYFCANCGSQLIAERTGNPRLVLRVATLDDDPNISPSFQIWKSHEVPWLEYGPQVTAYSEWEPGR